MEYSNGSKVEVWCKKQVAWRLAVVISSDRNYLFVRYDYQPVMKDTVAPKKVSKEIARPLPPVVAFTESFGVGEFVEVRALCSWNAAIILRVISEWFCLVRLLGSGEEVNITRTNIRSHQIWKQCEWTTPEKVCSPEVLGKSKNLCSLHRDGNLRYEVPSDESKTNIKPKDYVGAVLQDVRFEGFPLVFQRKLKRLSPNLSSNIEASSWYPHKRQATVRKNVFRKLEAGHIFHPLKKEVLKEVDNAACTKDIFSERNSHAYRAKQHTSFLETERKDLLGCVINSDYDGCDTDVSSVGSCSIINDSANMFSAYSVKEHSQSAHILCSDAKSCSLPEDKVGKYTFLYSVEELVAKEVRVLEVHAYHKMLETLYASGPISWEQETLLTNLRISLNISNDEHLIRVKSLISSETGSCFS